MLEGHVCNPCWGFIFYVESFQLKSRGCVLSELALGRIWRPMCDWLTDEGRRKGKKKKARMNVNDSCSLTFLWYVKNNAVVLNNPRGLLRSLLSFFFSFFKSSSQQGDMSWDVLICCSDRQKYCSACFQLHFTHISLFFLTTSTPFFMKRRDSVCFIFPPSLVFFFGFFLSPSVEEIINSPPCVSSGHTLGSSMSVASLKPSQSPDSVP